ncbi:DNA repair protein rad52 [Linnemannia zychae]|nr:DNA repair protein rad52 [Linnemannia zychae]
MITKTEPGLSRPNDNPFDITSSGQQHLQHNQQQRPPIVGHSGVAPVQPYKLHVDFTADEKAQLDADLCKYLPAEFTATRSGPGRSTLTYVEGWKIKNIANKLFGFNGWNSAITDVTVDFLEVDNDGKVTVGVSCIVRVTLKDGTYHEDVGYGSSENQRSKAASFEKAKKEAVTDALKRSLTSFGNLLGTCLYDKNYCRYLSNQRVEKTKFEGAEFYTLPTEARTHLQAAKPPPSSKADQPVQPQLNNHPSKLNQQQNHQNQQQNQQYHTGTGVNSSAHGSSWSAGPSNPNKPDGAQQGSAAGKRPIGPSFSRGSITSASESSTTASNEISMANPVAPTNKVPATVGQTMIGTGTPMQTKIKMEMDDDDLFFGPDFDDAAPSQALPESPRMRDFENLDVDLGDMMNDDSPTKPKATTSDVAVASSSSSRDSNNGLPATPRRSGSFGRSTSSPSLVQTTPTKKSQEEARRNQGPPPAAPFRATTPVSFAELNALKNTAYAPRSSSPQATMSSNIQGSTRPTLTTQNQQSGSNIGSRVQTPQSSNGGPKINQTTTGPAQSGGTTKTGPTDILRANSLAASTSVGNGQHGNSNTLSGYRPSANHNTSGQAHSTYGNNSGAGLKRPFINNG